MSTALENAMFTGLAANQGREQRRDSASRAAHNRLRAELIDALLNDPQRMVRTPSYQTTKAVEAAEAARETYIALPNLLYETLLIVARVAKGSLGFEDRIALQMRAQALIAAQGQQHAADHRDALVYSERDGRSDEERDEDARDDAIDWRSERQREERAFGEA